MNCNYSGTLLATLLSLCFLLLLPGHSFSQEIQPLPLDGIQTNGNLNISAKANLEIHHIDLHSDFDSTLIIAPNGLVFLIGGGNVDLANKYVMPYLRKMGIHTIDVMIAPYGTDTMFFGVVDNNSGLSAVLNSDIEVRYVVVNTSYPDWDYREGFLNSARNKATEGAYYISAGTEFDLGNGGKLTCIYSDAATVDQQLDSTWESVDEGICFILKCYNFEYFTGAHISGSEHTFRPNVEKFILPHLYDVDVMKLIANGSADSNSQALLSKLNPEVAIVSCNGTRGHYGATRASDSGIDVYNTGKLSSKNLGHGNVVVKVWNGKKYTINDKHAYYKDDIIPKDNTAPEPHFSITKHGIEYRKVIFDVSASTDDQKIRRFTLDFGDGTQKEFKLKKPITHIYPSKAKSYFPKLTAIDKWDFVGTYKDKVQIDPQNFKVSVGASTKSPRYQSYYDVYVTVKSPTGVPLPGVEVTAKIVYSTEPYSDFERGYTDAAGKVTLHMFAQTWLTRTSQMDIRVFYKGELRGHRTMSISVRGY